MKRTKPQHYVPDNLLSIDADPKTIKGRVLGILTAILYMSPADILTDVFGRVTSLCPFVKTMATHGEESPCVRACLYGSGRMIYDRNGMKTARENKAIYFLQDRNGFYSQLADELARVLARGGRDGLRVLCRPNGTTDIPHERIRPDLFDTPVGFYDYTKSLQRMLQYLAGELPSNYDLTFSWGGDNRDAAETVLSRGGNIAVPFHPVVPVGETFLGAEIISGDETDVRLREFDGTSKVIGLKWKMSARDHANGDRDLPTVTRARAIADGFCIATESIT